MGSGLGGRVGLAGFERLRGFPALTRFFLPAHAVGQQIAQGSTGVFGVMLESFLVGGRQDNGSQTELTYGQSITDACMSWDVTVPVIEGLADSVRQRRNAGG